MGPFKQMEDWMCPDASCGNNNFARRTECNKCGKAKPFNKATFKQQGHEIGENMAEMSHGLFSAEDWQCSQCGNVNWARRNTCNMCMTPKHKTVENRTGFGGGFMERERTVQYKSKNKSEDDDNIYDEFGRKKRKFRKESQEDGASVGGPTVDQHHTNGGAIKHSHHQNQNHEDLDRDYEGSRDAKRAKPKVNDYDDSDTGRDQGHPRQGDEEEDDEDDDDDEDADLSKYAFTDDEEEEDEVKGEGEQDKGKKGEVKDENVNLEDKEVKSFKDNRTTTTKQVSGDRS